MILQPGDEWANYGALQSWDRAASFTLTTGKIEILQLLRTTPLEYTSVYNGYFLDSFGMPYVKSYLPECPIVLDFRNKTVVIPASGDVPIAFTHTFDVAKFVASILRLEAWPKDSFTIGDRRTPNEILKIAKEITGIWSVIFWAGNFSNVLSRGRFQSIT